MWQPPTAPQGPEDCNTCQAPHVTGDSRRGGALEGRGELLLVLHGGLSSSPPWPLDENVLEGAPAARLLLVDHGLQGRAVLASAARAGPRELPQRQSDGAARVEE